MRPVRWQGRPNQPRSPSGWSSSLPNALSIAPLPREVGEAVQCMASLHPIISLNTNKKADLGGFHSIVRDCQPYLIFLQEVHFFPFLSSFASAFNYQCFSSTLVQPIFVLSFLVSLAPLFWNCYLERLSWPLLVPSPVSTSTPLY
jgi:hypothetical protein